MSLAKSSLFFSLGTLLSRFSGLIRDMVLFGVFGASSLLDAFIVAFRIPNLLREMLAEGALSSAFTKVYSSVMVDNRAAAVKLLRDTLIFFSCLAAFISMLGVIVAPYLVDLMSLNLSSDHGSRFLQNATSMTRILFPYLGLTIVSSVVTGALYERGSFFVSAVSPIAFNLGFILGAAFLSQWLNAISPNWFDQMIGDARGVGLAIGVLLGGIIQLMIQFSVVIRPMKNELRALGLNFSFSPELRNVIALMVPASIAASSGPINVFINTNFATSLGVGAVTWLNASFRLLQLPIGLFGVAVGMAVLPTLSRAIKNAGEQLDKNVSNHFQRAIELVCWLMLMCFTYIAVNHQAIISLIYQHGNFSKDDADATGRALFAYSFGILGYGLIKVLTSFYYAVEKTSFAMKVALFSVVINFIGNYFLVDYYGFIGLALTSAITLTINALILSLGLRSYQLQMNRSEFFRSFFILGLVSLMSGWLMTYFTGFFNSYFSDLHYKIFAALLLGANGMILIACFLIGSLLYAKKSPKDVLMTLKKFRRNE